MMLAGMMRRMHCHDLMAFSSRSRALPNVIPQGAQCERVQLYRMLPQGSNPQGGTHQDH